MEQQMPSKQQEQHREVQIESLSANAQLQQILFGNTRTAMEQKEEVEEQEQMAACQYCGDTGLQGLPCNQ